MSERIKTDILIIGGGAAGLTAAITAKLENPRLSVTIAERLSRTGKKILATGNGRCNIGNINISDEFYHGSVNNRMEIIEKMPSVTDFFESMGLYCTSDEIGRMYPYSNAASSVLSVLHNKVIECNINEICDFNVTKIEKTNGVFIVYNDDSYIISKKVIIAAGGCAGGNAMGTDGSMLKITEKLGHKITPLYPSIAPLKVNPDDLKGLKGIRVKGNVCAVVDGKKITSEKGEIQFNENNISGICIFNLSYLYAVYREKLHILIDICPDKSYSEVVDILYKLKKVNSKNTLESYLIGIFNKNLAVYLIRSIGKKNSDFISKLTDKDIKSLASKIKGLDFAITGQSEWKNAQVTYGGISGESVDLNLESKIIKGLYFAGEILDVDGICGGYNLMWAWASGIYAGINSVRSLGGKNDKNK